MQRGMLLVTILMALAVSGALSSAPVVAAPAPHAGRVIRVAATKDQLTLVMVISNRAYARGDIVPVTLRLHNSSTGARVLWVWGCHNPPYGVQVLDRNHRVVYPVATSSGGTRPCTGNKAPVLWSGKSVTYHVTVPLNGPFIRARVPFGVPESTGDTQEVLSTRAVAVGNF